jgi:hypothetical protein
MTIRTVCTIVVEYNRGQPPQFFVERRGFHYVVTHEGVRITAYRCRRRENQYCPAKIYIVKSSGIVVYQHSHNHDREAAVPALPSSVSRRLNES